MAQVEMYMFSTWDKMEFSMNPTTTRDSIIITLMGALMGALGMNTLIATGIIFYTVIPEAQT